MPSSTFTCCPLSRYTACTAAPARGRLLTYLPITFRRTGFLRLSRKRTPRCASSTPSSVHASAAVITGRRVTFCAMLPGPQPLGARTGVSVTLKHVVASSGQQAHHGPTGALSRTFYNAPFPPLRAYTCRRGRGTTCVYDAIQTRYCAHRPHLLPFPAWTSSGCRHCGPAAAGQQLRAYRCPHATVIQSPTGAFTLFQLLSSSLLVRFCWRGFGEDACAVASAAGSASAYLDKPLLGLQATTRRPPV